jgi:hypothetical protein
MRLEPDKRRNCARIPGGSFVSYRKILQDADVWSEKLLFNHLAYAAMRCSDQGYVTLDRLFSPIELGVQASVQQVAQYKEASLVQRGPARDAFVATVSQQLTDKLQDCCQFIKGGQIELGIKAPIASLINLPAEDTSEEANKPVRGSTPEPTTPESRMEGVRHSVRIAAARSMTVVAKDIPISNMEKGQAKELMLLARACANKEEAAGKDRNLDSKDGDDSEFKPQSYQEVGKLLHLRTTVGRVQEGQFYEYLKKVVALLELVYLKELEQGVFLRIPDSSQRELHPDLSKLAQRLRARQRERSIFKTLLDDCHLFALKNDIFCNKTFQQTTQTQEASNVTGEEPKPPPLAIDNGSTIIRDACLTIVEAGPESNYDYPPMLEALVQLGFLFEYDKGIFRCVRDPQLQKKAFSLGALATQAVSRGLENTFLTILMQQKELFKCSEVDTNERYWDKSRENFA